MAGVLVVLGLSGRTLARMVVDTDRRRVFTRDALRDIAVCRMRHGVPLRTVKSDELLVGRIVIVHVREQGFGRKEAETESEDQRGERAGGAGMAKRH